MDVALGTEDRELSPLQEAFRENEGVDESIQRSLTIRAYREVSASAFMDIAEVCKRFTLDQAGCSRLQSYLGPTLVALKAPMNITHRMEREDQGFKTDHCTVVNAAKMLATQGHYRSDPVSGFAVVDDVVRLFDRLDTDFNHNFMGIISYGDSIPWQTAKFPTLARARATAAATTPAGRAAAADGNHVLVLQERERFMGPMRNVPKIDIPFEEKQDRLVWRGCSTGSCRRDQSTDRYPDNSRLLVVEKYFNASSDIDIAFNVKCGRCPEAEHLLKPFVGQQDLLKSKLLMVVEGYAEATGLEWILSSNSAPVMARPTVESWTLHSQLVPWKHYIPVAPDFSDLKQQATWAWSHPAEVREIAHNGKIYMQEFQSIYREQSIAAAVLAAYQNRVKITAGFEDSELCSAKPVWDP